MSREIKKVIVVGAGPAGLLTAYMLAQNGIPVDVVEAADRINEAPRGLAYGPSTGRTLRKAGLLQTIIDHGSVAKSFTWRNLSGETLSSLEWENPTDRVREQYVMCPVGTLSKLLLELVEKQPLATVYWQHKVRNVGQDEGKAWVEIEGESSSVQRMEADFVVGCDGGTSGVRKALFGRNFPGFTWPIQFIAVNVCFDYDKHGWSDANWIVHPEHWHLAAKINSNGLWRIAYGEEPGLPLDQPSLEARVKEKLQIILPGRPTPDQFRLDAVSPYGIHQRLAEHMRVGRVLLAADAAHLNNPMGGLGLTTGMCDVGGVVDCLVGIHEGKASMDILDKYDEIRRRIFSTTVDPTTTTNLKRIMQDADEARAKDPFLTMLDQAAKDPDVMKEIEKFEMSIDYDMTEFYDQQEKETDATSDEVGVTNTAIPTTSSTAVET